MNNTTLLGAAIHGVYEDWRGLGGDESVATIVRALQPVARTFPAEERRRSYQRFVVNPLERAAPPVLVEIWSLVGGTWVFLVEWGDPLAADLESTLDHFGPPAAQLTGRRLAVGATVDELVYPSRGVTFSVATPYGEPGKRRLQHVQLFGPTTLESYITDIGTGPNPYPHPRPGVPQTK